MTAPTFRWYYRSTDRRGEDAGGQVWGRDRAHAERIAIHDCQVRGEQLHELSEHWDAVTWPDGTTELRCGNAGDAVMSYARQTVALMRSAGMAEAQVEIRVSTDSPPSIWLDGMPPAEGQDFFPAPRLSEALAAADAEITRVAQARRAARNDNRPPVVSLATAADIVRPRAAAE